ncbi:MAG: hypothetical protein NT092_14480 [Bacteroidia bacterium]|nr:hypothetical protein [Bacteroidia bacterium]
MKVICHLNIKGRICIVALLLTANVIVTGQAVGDYRSNATGNWNVVGTWQTYNGAAWVAAGAVPNSANGVITVRSPHIVTVTAVVAVDQVIVNAGGQITVNSGITLTIANGAGTDMTVSGTIVNSGTITTTGTLSFLSGSTYQHTQNGGVIPIAAWDAASNCTITGITNTIPTGGLGQTFGNFTWDCPNHAGNLYLQSNLTIAGDFTVSRTGATIDPNTQSLRMSNNAVGYTLSVTGDVLINNSGSFKLNNNTGGCTANVGGDLTINNGNFTIVSGLASSTLTVNGNVNMLAGTLILNENDIVSIGTLNVKGNFTLTGGDINTQASFVFPGQINFNGTTTQTYLKTAGTFTNNISFSVLSGSVLDVGTSLINGTGTGTFNLNSGAGIITAHANGLSTTAGTGSIQVSGTKTYNAGANYTYNGSSAQGTGNGLTGANNLTINNSSGVTLTSSATVTGTLTLTGGILATGANSLIVTNNSSTAVSGGSATSFVNGPLTWQLAAGSTYNFPVGAGSYLPFGITGITGTTPRLSVQAYTGNTGGSATAPLITLSTTEYWRASVISGTYSGGSVSLTRQVAINEMDDIGRNTTTLNGAYTTLGGTVSGTSLINSNNTGASLGYFVMATLKSITTSAISGSPFCSGSNVSVPYTITGTFYSGNVFTAQLSDASGSFASPVNIGTLTQTTAGTIAGTIPIATTTGTLYRIRVVSSNPSVTGSINGSNLIINASPVPTFTAQPGANTCVGVSVTYTTQTGGGITNYVWTVPGVSGTDYTITAGGTGNGSNTVTLRWLTTGNRTVTVNYNNANGCTGASAASNTTTVNALPVPTFTAQPGANTCVGVSITYTTQTGGGITNYVWTVPGVSGTDYTITAGGIGNASSTVTLRWLTTGSKTVTVNYNNASGCTGASAASSTTTVNALPVATFSYTGTPYCINASNPFPTFNGGGVAGTFSSTAGLVFVSAATGQINLAASTTGTYTVTNTIAAAGGCVEVTATSPVTIISDLIWTGTVSTDWNVPGNWSCGFLPILTTTVQIPNVSNKPVLSSGATGTVNNLTIESGSSLTITDNTIRISGTITNSGTFDVTGGTIELNGTSAQTIAANLFSTNRVRDLIINNAAGATLQGTLNVTRSLLASSGNLATGDYLTLVSASGQTAYIDGAGSGNVLGDVTMQRYLPSGFGYRYISSPFQAAKVSQLSPEVDLASAFPLVYRYDENRVSSGWVSHVNPVFTLNPLQGYSANFGIVAVPEILDITGVVNNGTYSVTLYNHNYTYTKGMNLVGNPYPSPIDWKAAAGWTKTNIDAAIYYFKPSGLDQYGGQYASFVPPNSSSDGIVSNIIPSMQGFFVHVTDGSYPVTGTLAMDNQVRVNNLSQTFSKSAAKGEISELRLTVSFDSDTTIKDALLIYADDLATGLFDNKSDALKIFNTDLSIPNLYSTGTDGNKLSINGLPYLTGTALQLPLGIKANINGTVVIKMNTLTGSFAGNDIYFTDIVAGSDAKLNSGGEYRVYLPKAEYLNRFYLNINNITTGFNESKKENPVFAAWISENVVKAQINELQNGEGTVYMTNMLGQRLTIKKIFEPGIYEFTLPARDGVYFMTFVSGGRSSVHKVIYNR